MRRKDKIFISMYPKFYFIGLVKSKNYLIGNSLLKFNEITYLWVLDKMRKGHTPETGTLSSCYPCSFEWSSRDDSICNMVDCKGGHWAKLPLILVSKVSHGTKTKIN